MTTVTRRAQLCESMQCAVHATVQVADFPDRSTTKNTCHAVANAIAIAIAIAIATVHSCAVRVRAAPWHDTAACGAHA